MSLSERYYAWSLRGLERRLARKRVKIEALRRRKEEKAITPHTFAARKGSLDAQIRELTARVSTMKGALRQERHPHHPNR